MRSPNCYALQIMGMHHQHGKMYIYIYIYIHSTRATRLSNPPTGHGYKSNMFCSLRCITGRTAHCLSCHDDATSVASLPNCSNKQRRPCKSPTPAAAIAAPGQFQQLAVGALGLVWGVGRESAWVGRGSTGNTNDVTHHIA